jgi:hypothetical protein
VSARRRAAWTVLLLLVGAAVGSWLYGLGAGGGFYHRLVRAPLAPASDAPYYRESLLHVGLAHGLGLGATLVGFRVFVLAFWWAALAVVTSVALRRLGLLHALLVWLVALTHPAAMIVHAWTCHPDAVLLLLAISLMLARPTWLIAPLAALAAWTNLPMAIAVAGSTALLWRGFAEEEARRRSVALLLGLVVGAASCRLTLWLAGVHLARDRFVAAAEQEPAVLLGRWTDVGWSGIYTLYFAHLMWLPALVAVLRGHRRGAAAALVATQLVALVAAVLAEDTTRVFACLAWAPLLYALIRGLTAIAGARDRWRLRPLVLLAVFVSLVGPKQFAWKGRLHGLEGAHAHLRALLR